MTTIAVIIPYYQREEGILERAVRSVIGQDVAPDTAIHLIVVDDSSPFAPESDLGVLSWPDHVSYEIVKRANGGPAAARNTGLGAVDNAVDFIAFLDSDDIWRPSHLRIALASLETGGPFHFSDNQFSVDQTWFETISFFQKGEDLTVCEILDAGSATFRFPGLGLIKPILRACLPHTSTVVLRSQIRDAVHFDDDLRYSGEDYLCWVRLAARYPGPTFSKQVLVERGRGIDLFRGSLEWDNVRTLYQIASAMVSVLRMEPFCQDQVDRDFVSQRAAASRRTIAYLLLRNLVRDPNGVLVTARFLTRNDRRFWRLFPGNLLSMLLSVFKH